MQGSASPISPMTPPNSDHLPHVACAQQTILENRNSGLPSPPLTRVGTNESRFRTDDAQPSKTEMDVTEWHPLAETQDATIVDDDDELDYEKTVQRSPIRIDFKSPSPQPWDLTDPPGHGTDYYSTIDTRNFAGKKSRPPIPHSSYYVGPPPADCAYGTPAVGQIGLHHPREIVRIERDYTGGELVQFAPTYPLEFEGRITPTQFLETVNAINEVLISAHSIRYSVMDNVLAMFSLQLSRLVITSHYEKEMKRLQQVIDELNTRIFNPAGLNILWPHKVAFLFLEIEYY